MAELRQTAEELDAFRKKFEAFVKNPKVAGTIDEFYGNEETYSGLWISGEEGNELGVEIEGTMFYDCAFNYWAMDYKVNPKMEKFLEHNGYMAEWNDAGTVMLYKD